MRKIIAGFRRLPLALKVAFFLVNVTFLVYFFYVVFPKVRVLQVLLNFLTVSNTVWLLGFQFWINRRHERELYEKDAEIMRRNNIISRQAKELGEWRQLYKTNDEP